MKWFNRESLNNDERHKLIKKLIEDNKVFVEYAETSSELLRKLAVKVKRLEEKAYFIEEDF